MRHVATMMTGTVDVIEKGSEFEKAKALLEDKVSAVQGAVSDKRRRKCYPVLQADQGSDMGLRCGRTPRTSLAQNCRVTDVSLAADKQNRRSL